MHVRDLRHESPRRWNERISGVAWLPRLIDKARAALAGTLGPYLFGQSPMDRECLHALGLGHRTFAQIVARAADDDAVLAAIEANDPSAIARARAWSDDLSRKHGTFLSMLDIDDGYAPGWRPLKPLANGVSFLITWTLKRLYPSRATEGLEQSW
jgi:hypothetical protein